MNDRKKIAFNAIAIYVKLLITTIVGLLTSRYVLQALGQSDFGLYNVVGSVIVLINTIGIAMHTTTRRYINVEMGKGDKGNPNKIFNISLLLHIGIAIAFFIVAETIGILYINNYLQVDSNKLEDANFVFQVSTVVACIGLINIPYQGLMDAFQKFWQIALLDIFNSSLKLIMVVTMLDYTGNTLRYYAISMSILTLVSFIFYHISCYIQWKNIVKWKLYSDRGIYREILVFNNYTALGAASFLGRTQGSAMVINYFFGTMVNGALAIAYQVQAFTSLFAGNVETAAAPQITQAYSAGDRDKAFNLCSMITRYTILITCVLFFPVVSGLNFLLTFWLKEVPEGAIDFTMWIMIVSLAMSFSGSISTYVQAMGKVKWFQILGSILEISPLPISFVCYLFGSPAITILVILSIVTIVKVVLYLVLLNRIDDFKSILFAKLTYIRPVLVILILLVLYSFIEQTILEQNFVFSILKIGVMATCTLAVVVTVGLHASERIRVIDTIHKRIRRS